MTHDTPPKRIWAYEGPSGNTLAWPFYIDGASEYILTSEAEAMVAAALRGAAHVDWMAGRDVADTAPEYLNDWQRGLVAGQSAFRDAILALIPQPASAALDKLIAEAVNEAMLQCTGIVANLRNKRNPGPLFEVLNRAMSDIEDARFAAIREKNNG